ncbi:MAG: hypothetical protein ACMUIM_08825 [bacterium]
MNRKSLLIFFYLILLLFWFITSAMGNEIILSGVPIYYWYRGCAPTAAGMLVAYYDNLAQFSDLITGIDTKNFDLSKSMIASIYDTTSGLNSLWDFMNTGGYPSYNTLPKYIPTGLQGFFEGSFDIKDDSSLTVGYKNSFNSSVWNDPNLSWAEYVAEIDAGRPVLLSWKYSGGLHCTIGIGYRDDDSDPSDSSQWEAAIYTTWAGYPEPSWWFFSDSKAAENPFGASVLFGTIAHLYSPDPIELKEFQAEYSHDHIVIIWETESELDTVGFNIWRSENEAGEYIKISLGLIDANLGTPWGAEYTYCDDDLLPGKTCYYKIEEIRNEGEDIFHGPVSVPVPYVIEERQIKYYYFPYWYGICANLSPWIVYSFSLHYIPHYPSYGYMPQYFSYGFIPRDLTGSQYGIDLGITGYAAMAFMSGNIWCRISDIPWMTSDRSGSGNADWGSYYLDYDYALTFISP